MGLFETFETMSYPPLYKIGFNSVYYLLNKYFIDSDLFIRELYIYRLYQNITGDEAGMKAKIFENISEEKLQKILVLKNHIRNILLKLIQVYLNGLKF